jgi:hypothetical protein
MLESIFNDDYSTTMPSPYHKVLDMVANKKRFNKTAKQNGRFALTYG